MAAETAAETHEEAETSNEILEGIFGKPAYVHGALFQRLSTWANPDHVPTTYPWPPTHLQNL